jgi:ABC-type uncharacterized transport system involved in gliding motility auxiliary subunit
MTAFNIIMLISAFLCIISAFFVAHHNLWMYKESKPTIKELLFHWGVLVLPQLLLAIFFIYNFIKS